jgi:hypothetical protein
VYAVLAYRMVPEVYQVFWAAMAWGEGTIRSSTAGRSAYETSRRRSRRRRRPPSGHQGSVFDRPDLMRDLTARKTTPPARSQGPATMIGSIV